ncbi:MAG: hypothetical protein D3904_14960 [Candidatus Electrothrix sp. EH2]|nr:hypothetical protein [Candidatus Electrothrix sp. EH2]
MARKGDEQHCRHSDHFDEFHSIFSILILWFRFRRQQAHCTATCCPGQCSYSGRPLSGAVLYREDTGRASGRPVHISQAVCLTDQMQGVVAIKCMHLI